MRVILGADKEGLELKNSVKNYLEEKGYEVVDKSENPSENFVASTSAVTSEILKDDEARGILFDKYGAGSFITATKVKGIVVAEVSEERSAYMTREHNNARIITLGQDIVGKGLANNIVKAFIDANYDGGRHQVRVDMLNAMC
ncbi:galactose-6-phosphate isomerase subunit LacA [Dolosicoccus paucivorans]|uniref:galactose-6-phosphate isomerase subunit LacA n=1 Tax=Dolosicoccus paucivorans TaxID=84521 RepID=UPI000C807BC4|nr:galactose-6-phosphate isomerase subunit LacA [Dolosicoccus paucivorans]PMB85162.1 galactose-6-phosphate isomerase subunit LacA [Dolosicoccus paucivorans]